jgi:hypothetical protein
VDGDRIWTRDDRRSGLSLGDDEKAANSRENGDRPNAVERLTFCENGDAQGCCLKDQIRRLRLSLTKGG